jgi:hypothetical protein
MLRWSLLTVLVTALLLCGAPSARAHATDPPELLGNATVVHACVSSRGGMVQVVDPTTGGCAFGATPLHWGLVGPAGTNGTNATATTVLSGGSCGPVFQAGGTAERVTRPGSCSAEPTPFPIPFSGTLTDLRVRLPSDIPAGVVADVIVALDGEPTSLFCSTGSTRCELLGQSVPVTAGMDLTVIVIVTDVVQQAGSGAADLVYSLVLTPAPAP